MSEFSIKQQEDKIIITVKDNNNKTMRKVVLKKDEKYVINPINKRVMNNKGRIVLL